MQNSELFWQEHCQGINERIDESSISAQSNIVAILWKEPQLYHQYDMLAPEDFNEEWGIYFEIGRQIIVEEKKNTLDELTVNFHLLQRDKLSQPYNSYGGYESIDKAKEYVDVSNIEGYIRELNKFKALKKLVGLGFPVEKNYEKYMDMNISDIYDLLEAQLNNVFINTNSDVKSFNIADGIDDLIEDLNEGKMMGLGLNDSALLSDQIGGILNGNIYLLASNTGAGKSFLMCRWLLPSIIEKKEQICLIINEESQARIQKELLLYYCNFILKSNPPITKTMLKHGKFTEEVMKTLQKAADEIKKLKKENIITIIPLETYNCDIAVKIIKKYSALGCKKFVLDTLKLSNNARGESWLSLMNDMVKLYDTIKDINKNVSLFVTMQLMKASLNQRYLNTSSIGVAKNVSDVCSVVLESRLVLEDEKQGRPKELQVYNWEQDGSLEYRQVKKDLDEDKSYMVIFVTKNRFGEANNKQIVAEVDFNTCYYKEIGYTSIIPDTF